MRSNGFELAGRTLDLALVADPETDSVAVVAVETNGSLSDRTAGSMPSDLFTGDAAVEAVAAYASPSTGEHHAFAAANGELVQLRLTDDGARAVTGEVVRRVTLPGSGSVGGIVVDGDAIYVAMDDIGIVSVAAEPTGGDEADVVYDAADGRFPADLGGLAAHSADAGSVLVAVSPGDDSVALFDIAAGFAYRGRIRIAASGGIDAVEGPVGIAATGAGLGSRFPSGMVAVHDAHDDSAETASNLKPSPGTPSRRRLAEQTGSGDEEGPHGITRAGPRSPTTPPRQHPRSPRHRFTFPDRRRPTPLRFGASGCQRF